MDSTVEQLSVQFGEVYIQEIEAANKKIQDEEKKKLRIKKLMHQVKLLMVVRMLKEDATPIEIMDHLFIGSIAAAYAKEALDKAQIKHILTVCDSTQQLPEFNYLQINVSDTVDQKINDHFKTASKFIHDGLTQKENVFVHCFAGKSRSTSFIIAYLIEYHQMTYDEALLTVKSKRPIAQPNQGFMKQLKDFYSEFNEQ